MIRKLTLSCVVLVPVVLAGCANQEAGAFLDGGTFGNATMNNHLVQTCQGVSNSKWAGGKCPPRTLDGKYARVTYNEYVQSATNIPPITSSFGQAGTE